MTAPWTIVGPDVAVVVDTADVDLVEALRRAAVADDPLDAIIGELSGLGRRSETSFGIALREPGAIRLFLRGEASATVVSATDAGAVIRALGVATWAEHLIADPQSVTLTIGSNAGPGVVVAVPASTAAGQTEPEAAPQPEAEALPEPDAAPDPEALSEAEAQPEPEAAPEPEANPPGAPPAPEPDSPDAELEPESGHEPEPEPHDEPEFILAAAPIPEPVPPLPTGSWSPPPSPEWASQPPSEWAPPPGPDPTPTWFGADPIAEPVAEPIATETLASEATELPSGDFEPWHPPDETADGMVPQPPEPEVPSGSIQGLVCPYGHPNPVGADTCRRCHVAILDRTPRVIPQPSLGVLRFGDGTVVELDRSVVIGRKPAVEPGDQDPPPTPIVIRDPDNSLSRTHAVVYIDGWEVIVVDKGSVNHTYVQPPGSDRVRLEPETPCPIGAGTIVSLADITEFVYEVPQP